MTHLNSHPDNMRSCYTDFPMLGKRNDVFSNAWKNNDAVFQCLEKSVARRSCFSNVWKNESQSLQGLEDIFPNLGSRLFPHQLGAAEVAEGGFFEVGPEGALARVQDVDF